MTLTTDYAARKALPIATGVLDYFPDAILAVCEASVGGNKQHLPGQPLHWDKSKSADEADALLRHLIERGTVDTDGVRHSAKVAWRALALLQREIDSERRVAAAMEAPVMMATEVLRRQAERAVNPPIIEKQVYVDRGDGKIEAQTRVQPGYGRSVLDDPDVKAAMAMLRVGWNCPEPEIKRPRRSVKTRRKVSARRR